MSTRAEPADTARDRLVREAQRQIQRTGYQGTGINQILGAVGLTKGALYHHFQGKEGLGHAVVDEIVGGWIQSGWIDPIEEGRPIVETLLGILDGIQKAPDDGWVAEGCMLLNISQEMSAVDEAFRLRTKAIFDRWRGAIAEAIERDQQAGVVRPKVDADAMAAFIVASHEGALSLAKNDADIATMKLCHRPLIDVIRGLAS